MKLSVYNNLVEHADGTILHNLVSGGMIVLKARSLQSYKLLQEGDFSDVRFVQKMRDFGFVVDDVDERDKMRDVYDNRINGHLDKNVFIVTTDRCNLGCYYCYEEKNQWIKMSSETQEDCKIFIEKMITGTQTDRFGLCWFGGEPTLNMEAIENINDHVVELCRKHNVELHQFMVTNGTTMTERNVEKLIKWGIKRFQITVDGFKDDHDKSRPYLKDVDPNRASDAQKQQLKKLGLALRMVGDKAPPPLSSYEAIMEGMELLVARGAVISLRMNVNEDNLPRAVLLLDDIKSRGWLKKNNQGGYVYAYSHPIFEPEYSMEKKRADSGCGSCSSGGGCSTSGFKMMKMSDFAAANKPLRDWHAENELSYFLHYRQMRFLGDTCTANRRSEYVINPDGTLVKCTHHAGNPDRSIGHVKDHDPNINTKDLSAAFHQFHPFEDQECRDCHVLPICLGGCKSSNLVDRETGGKFDKGCIAARYDLPYEIIEFYEAQKRKKSKPQSELEPITAPKF
jgi:uncharacterized protein